MASLYVKVRKSFRVGTHMVRASGLFLRMMRNGRVQWHLIKVKQYVYHFLLLQSSMSLLMAVEFKLLFSVA